MSIDDRQGVFRILNQTLLEVSEPKGQLISEDDIKSVIEKYPRVEELSFYDDGYSPKNKYSIRNYSPEEIVNQIKKDKIKHIKKILTSSPRYAGGATLRHWFHSVSFSVSEGKEMLSMPDKELLEYFFNSESKSIDNSKENSSLLSVAQAGWEADEPSDSSDWKNRFENFIPIYIGLIIGFFLIVGVVSIIIGATSDGDSEKNYTPGYHVEVKGGGGAGPGGDLINPEAEVLVPDYPNDPPPNPREQFEGQDPYEGLYDSYKEDMEFYDKMEEYPYCDPEYGYDDE